MVIGKTFKVQNGTNPIMMEKITQCPDGAIKEINKEIQPRKQTRFDLIIEPIVP